MQTRFQSAEYRVLVQGLTKDMDMYHGVVAHFHSPLLLVTQVQLAQYREVIFPQVCFIFPVRNPGQA